jgi:hypothetical protein
VKYIAIMRAIGMVLFTTLLLIGCLCIGFGVNMDQNFSLAVFHLSIVFQGKRRPGVFDAENSGPHFFLLNVDGQAITT